MKACRILLMLSALSWGGSLLPASPFEGAVDLGGGNRYLEWFDYFNDQFYPWVYHFDHGWLYSGDENPSSLWLWSPGLGWLWTSKESYPNIYEQNRGWIYYARGSVNPRWFFDRAPEEWVSDAAVASSASYFPVPEGSQVFTWDYSVNGGNPVGGQVDDVELFLSFSKYSVRFSGRDLLQNSTMEADATGRVLVDGFYYPIVGVLTGAESSQFVRDDLGVYLDDSSINLSLAFSVVGNSFLVNASANTNVIGELLVNLPWRADLYQLPVGTVYEQWASGGWVSGTYEVWANDFLEDRQNFSTPFYPAIRYELIDKIPLYILQGRSYSDVVVIRASVHSPDPFGGPSEDLETEMWLAPGVGLIRSRQEEPVLNDPVELILTHTNLW